MFGYELGQNFNLPYISRNPSEFWRRWHISLSSWFKEYVYIPLGGNRAGKYRTYFNLFVTMVLSGLWHGANWTYILWGALHGILSIISKCLENMHTYFLKKDYYNEFIDKLRSTIFYILNILFIWLLWIPFRADSLNSALSIIKGIITNQNGVSYFNVWAIVFTVFIMGLQLWRGIKYGGSGKWGPLDFNKLGNKIVFIILVLFIIIFSYVGESAFIYANF